MPIYGITLEPDDVLSQKIKELKKEAESLVGDQLYLKDEPHLTLHHGDFKDVNEWDADFQKVMKEIKEEIKNFQIKISEWLLFKGDAVTKKNTLACDIDEDSLLLARKIQKKVVDFLNQYRNKEIVERYRNSYERLGETEKQNIEKYGYPFVGEIFKPHFGIASFDKEAFEKVWVRLKEKCPKGNYDILSLNVYSLEGKNEILKLQKKYFLQNHHNL